MSIKLREKANSFDRILRQRAANYLKNAEKQALELMELSYDKNLSSILKRVERLKNGISKIKADIEYGSFLSLPAFRSGRRFHTETPTLAEEEIYSLLLVGELILLECRNLFEKLQAIERESHSSTESQLSNLLVEAEESLRRIEKLQLSRSSYGEVLLDSLITSYGEKVNELENLAEKEDLLALEKIQLSEVVAMNKGSIFARFISLIARKPVFEKEISDVILSISEKLKVKSGGLVRLSTLYSMIKVARPTLNISLKDVENVVRKLERNGLIPGLREISGVKIVELVPVTVTPDQDVVLKMAADRGELTLEEILLKTKWTYERATRALKQMEELGVCKYDMVTRKWTFPAFAESYNLEELSK